MEISPDEFLKEMVSYKLPDKQIVTYGYVYFLYMDKILVYIGKSISLEGRIREHLRTRDFDEIRIGQCKVDLLDEMEAILIDRFRPIYNSCKSPEKYFYEKDLLFGKEEKRCYKVDSDGVVYGKKGRPIGWCDGEKLALINFQNLSFNVELVHYDFETKKKEIRSSKRLDGHCFKLDDNFKIQQVKREKVLKGR